MIVDAHAHLVAPDSLYAHRSNLSSANGQYGDPYRATVSDADLEKSSARNVAIMDGVGTDLQLLSPRPFLTVNGDARWENITSWVWDQNDTIARTVEMHPTRFRGVGALLPQQAGRSIVSVFDAEIKRVTEDLGFVGLLINPDPGEGSGKTPPLGDPYWYPLYERLCELDLPGHIHSGCCSGRETYDEHFISEESLAITSIYRAGVFDRFPNLNLMISHGGGAIPYQVGRWRSHPGVAARSGYGRQRRANIRPDPSKILVRHLPAQQALAAAVVRYRGRRTLLLRHRATGEWRRRGSSQWSTLR